MSRVMQSILSIALTTVLLIVSNTPRTAWAGDEVSPLQRALGSAFYAKAELALLKGQLNRGKVYLAAAHEADPGISPLALKAMDMMHKDFPFVQDIVPGYRRGPCGFSGDQKFVTVCQGSILTRLDLTTGQVKKVRIESEFFLYRQNISPKGRFVVVSDNIGNLVLFDMESEKLVGSFSFRKEKPRSLKTIEMDFSPDETTIAAYYGRSEKHAIYFLRTEDLSIARTLPVKEDLSLPVSLRAKVRVDVRPVRYLSDKSLLLGMGRQIVIADASTMEVSKTLAPLSGWDADYLAEKNLIAVGGSGSIKVFNTETQEKIAEYQAASHNIVLVRYLTGGRYIVYASPKGESGIIDCASGKLVQVFTVGRDAAVSTGRYLLLTQGKVIDLSACRPYEGAFKAFKRYADSSRDTDIPDSVDKALAATLDKAISKKTGPFVTLVVKSDSGRLGAFGTRDGRTFIYDYDKTAQEVKMLLTDYFRAVTDLVFLPDESHLVRLCKTGNGIASAVEVYSLLDGKRNSLRMDDPAVSLTIVEGGRATIILDQKNRVFLSTLPSLDCKIELLGAAQISREIHVDQQTKTLVVKTGEQIDPYDMRKVSADATIPTYEDAVERYGISLNESEPLWPLVHP